MLSFSDTRTLDVHTSKTFVQLLIHPDIVQSIKSAGYAGPTPIQAGALPLGLMGNDLLVQAKSGTGKTLVFATLASQLSLRPAR
uniref:RNA helicase n=1 Tax=Panagrellus redivivus TaxID=6233 RepID=A0A7E4VXD3_PANRE